MQQKWPKRIPELSPENKIISDDFMQYWHVQLANSFQYKMIENFNQGYAVANSQKDFLTTLEIGAGLGEHLKYENLNSEQKKNYIAVDIRENMVNEIKKKYPDVQSHVGDCQNVLSFSDNHFDRVLAIHILEHLPNLPAAIKEIYRVCHKTKGRFFVVIPCEGGFLYTLARKLSAQPTFEKRYKQSYQWFIEREHINRPHEIVEELTRYFEIEKSRFFPFYIKSTHLNLCIGLTLKPLKHVEQE